MNCVSCGAVLPEDARYCTECGAYLPEMGRILAESPRPTSPRTPPAAASKKFLGLFRRTLSYRCETMQDIDRFSRRTPVTLQLYDDEQRLFIAKGAAQISMPYHQILDFSIRRSEGVGQDKNLLDVLQSVIGLKRRWIATLTYQTQEVGTVKHLQFMELESSGYYKEEAMSGHAKRFEKAMDKIIQHYHPCGQLD